MLQTRLTAVPAMQKPTKRRAGVTTLSGIHFVVQANINGRARIAHFQHTPPSRPACSGRRSRENYSGNVAISGWRLKAETTKAAAREALFGGAPHLFNK